MVICEAYGEFYSFDYFLSLPYFMLAVGNSVPISKVRDDVVAAYKREMEWQTNSMLLPFKQMCSKRQVNSNGQMSSFLGIF